MAVATGTIKEAKYTQGFHFRLDEAGQDRPRQLAERSCTALATLMQELFIQAERQVSQPLTLDRETLPQQRLLEQLGDIVRARPVVERAVLSSVVCAFAGLEDRACENHHNRDAIERVRSSFMGQISETQDLIGLLDVNDRVVQANNRNRPLLVHLNAQLAVVFRLREFRLQNSPLGPATLTSGFIAGLLCARVDLATKQLLFRMFEQHFLARLSVLLNSISLRLEEEGVQINKAVSFDETDVGAMAAVLHRNPPHDPERVTTQRKQLQDCLGRRSEFIALPSGMVETLESVLEQDGPEAYMDLLSELNVIRRHLEYALLRADVHHRETSALAAIRSAVAEQLNVQMEGKQLPVFLRAFLSRQWPDVLFDVAVSHGVGSSQWMNVTLLQQQLLESVSPAASEEQQANLARLVPSLVKNLRDRLESAGCSLVDSNHFFAQLKPFHLANVQQKLDTRDFIPWQRLSLDSCMPVEAVLASDADRDFYEQARTIVG